MFRHLKHFSWSNYYENNINSNEIYENKQFSFKNESLNIISGNAYIYNCYFQYLVAPEGGAILYSVAGSNLLVEKSTINNCTATFDTAGIRVSNGNCVIVNACSKNGYAGNNDGFCSITSDSTRSTNYVIDSSISHCEAINEYTMYHDYGPIFIKSVNLSYNKASYVSALRCAPSKIDKETKHGFDVNYCSFLNNTAGKEHCLRMSNQLGISCTHDIKNCNIIENAATKTIHSLGETTIFHCSILNNGNPCFHIEDAKSKISLSMCYTDKPDLGSISQNDNQISEQFIISLSFYQTMFCANHFCHCEYTKNSFLQNLFIHKIIIPSPFIFLLLSNKK